MYIKFSIAALTILAGITLYIPMSAKSTVPNTSNSSLSTIRPPIRSRGSAMLSQATQRANYQEIPLGNISSPLVGKDPKILALQAFPFPELPVTQQFALSNPTANQAVAIITQVGLEDDSIRGMKYRIELNRTGQEWKIVWAGYQVRCWQGRGHQNWSSVNCI